MLDSAARMMAKVQEVRRAVALLMKGIRLGTVASVDSSAGTVVVEYPDRTDTSGQPMKSHPYPWLQRSTEHRPPAVGDHALVIDPSLGNGGAVVWTGWPSTANPPPDGGGDIDVIHRQRGGPAGDFYQGPDREIVAGDMLVDADAIALDAPDIALGVSPTDYAALAAKVDLLWTTLDAVFRSGWTPSPMDGGSALKAAWLAAFSTPPQSVAASQVKVK